MSSHTQFTFYNQWIRSEDLNQLSDSDEASAHANAACAKAVMGWVRGFIMKPNRALKRPGSVCPFVAPALEEEKVYFCFSDDTGVDEATLMETLLREGDRFKEAFSAEQKKNPLLSLMLLFPEMSEASYPTLCLAKAAVKAKFLEQGMMLGEFYPGNPDSSVHNEALRVADAPAAMIVIRGLASHDQLFLHTEPELYKWYLDKYPAKSHDV